MNPTLITHLLASMESAVSAIQNLAISNGYEGDPSAPADVADYIETVGYMLEDSEIAHFAAESRTLRDALALIETFSGHDVAIATARKLASFAN